MDDRHHHHLTRELERQIEQMTRRMEEQQRDLEQSLTAMRQQFEEPAPRSEHSGRLPEEEGVTGRAVAGVRTSSPPFSPAGTAASGLPAGPEMLNIDIIDQDEELVLTAAVPGFSQDEIDVSLADDVLHIEATKEESETQEDEGRYVQRERHRSLSRSVALGTPIAEDADISGHYENGMLTIRLPKAGPAEDESARQIDIA